MKGYWKAVRLVRGDASEAEVRKALGTASPDGPEGNIWALLADRARTAAEPIPSSLVQFQANVTNARDGNPEVASIFEQLSVLLYEFDGSDKSIGSLKNEVVQALKALRVPPVRRTALAATLFGEAAAAEILKVEAA